jgi:hypothetical protein
MPNVARYLAQAGVYALPLLLVAYLSAAPVYRQIPDDAAQIKLSFRHGAQRVETCRRLTTKEIAALPANKRRPNDCARQRAPIVVQIILDGRSLYDAVLEPTGLSRDGPAETYEKFVVTAGRHRLVARLRDSKRSDGGFDYERVADVELAPFQNLAIDFKADQGGFIIR